MYYLYKITNKINGKFYIGMTKNLERRWTVHCSAGSKCPKLKAAISCYGRESFTKEILCIGEKEYILDLEEKLIGAYNNTVTGYNIHKGGKFYKSEHKIPTEKDNGIYASGFWFPDTKTTLEKLNMKQGTFYKRTREGVLGNVLQRPRGALKGEKTKPVYVKGFWFPSTEIAGKSLGIIAGTADYYARYSPEPGDLRAGSQKGDKSSSAKAVVISGVKYGSTKEASRETGIHSRTIVRRIKNNTDGYSYASEEDK